MFRTFQQSSSCSSPAATTSTNSCFYPTESLSNIESKPVSTSPSRKQQKQEEEDVQKVRKIPAHTTRTTWTKLTVTGYTIRDSEKRVMYHIDVHSVTTCITKEGQPEEESFAPIDRVYTIRRSYSDFKALHEKLSSLISLHRKTQSMNASSPPEPPPLLNASVVSSSSSSSSVDGLSSVSTAMPDHPKSSKKNNSTSSSDHKIHSFLSLPSLPSVGFLSYWKRHDRSHLQSRCEIFQEILDLVLQNDFFKNSEGVQHFLSIAPSAFRPRGSSYVSLCEYSIPQEELKINHFFSPEIQKRKILERRRNSSVHPPYARLGSTSTNNGNNGFLILPQGNQQQQQPSLLCMTRNFSSKSTSSSNSSKPLQDQEQKRDQSIYLSE
jgi:hypothetical protein